MDCYGSGKVGLLGRWCQGCVVAVREPECPARTGPKGQLVQNDPVLQANASHINRLFPMGYLEFAIGNKTCLKGGRTSNTLTLRTATNIMFKKTLVGLSVALLSVGCSDITSPLDGASFKKKKNNDVTVTTTGSTENGGATQNTNDGTVPATTIAQSTEAPPLLTYSTSFTAIQGQANTFIVFYEDEWNPGMQGDWFLKLNIPRDGQLLDENGNPAAPGDTVQITVEIDPSLFFVRFGPHGSSFNGNKPATLQFNYAYAQGGWNQNDLAVWYQPADGEAWNEEPTEVNTKKNRVLINLYHFSNYAVAW